MWLTGQQRSTYRLQLPYVYGVPLVIISSGLHWLVSQSLFLARVTMFDSLDVKDGDGMYRRVGPHALPS